MKFRGKITSKTEFMDSMRRDLADSKSSRVRVGLLRNKADRQDADWNTQDINNPTLGAIHEFGSKSNNIPARSFLRMPITTKLPDEVKKIREVTFKALAKKAGIHEALRQLGVLAENVVQEAFATRGFGQWAPNAPSTVRKKGSSSPLIDTAQMRKAISSKVMGGKQ